MRLRDMCGTPAPHRHTCAPAPRPAPNKFGPVLTLQKGHRRRMAGASLVQRAKDVLVFPNSEHNDEK